MSKIYKAIWKCRICNNVEKVEVQDSSYANMYEQLRKKVQKSALQFCSNCKTTTAIIDLVGLTVTNKAKKAKSTGIILS